MSFVIRPGEPSDLDSVGELHALSRTYAYSWQSPPEPLKAMWHERFGQERETHRLLVAISGTSLIGFAYVGDGVLHAIHVHPDWHGKGAGPELMRHSRQSLRELGFHEATLWVIDGNDRACRFYEKDGWRRSGATRVSEVDGVPTRQLEYITSLRTG